jgi:hypothetical protein
MPIARRKEDEHAYHVNRTLALQSGDCRIFAIGRSLALQWKANALLAAYRHMSSA